MTDISDRKSGPVLFPKYFIDQKSTTWTQLFSRSFSLPSAQNEIKCTGWHHGNQGLKIEKLRMVAHRQVLTSEQSSQTPDDIEREEDG